MTLIIKNASLESFSDSSVGISPSNVELSDLNFYMEKDDIKPFGDACDALMEVITGEPCEKVHLVAQDETIYFIQEDKLYELPHKM